ncbi:MAG: hypothetical protein FH749_04765 [Firmicutes bacterium]|nr:hypothetical protein [Bacillota bacterium]
MAYKTKKRFRNVLLLLLMAALVFGGFMNLIAPQRASEKLRLDSFSDFAAELQSDYNLQAVDARAQKLADISVYIYSANQLSTEAREEIQEKLRIFFRQSDVWHAVLSDYFPRESKFELNVLYYEEDIKQPYMSEQRINLVRP